MESNTVESQRKKPKQEHKDVNRFNYNKISIYESDEWDEGEDTLPFQIIGEGTLPPHTIQKDASDQSEDMMPLKSKGEDTLPPNSEGEDRLPRESRGEGTEPPTADELYYRSTKLEADTNSLWSEQIKGMDQMMLNIIEILKQSESSLEATHAIFTELDDSMSSPKTVKCMLTADNSALQCLMHIKRQDQLVNTANRYG